VGGQNMPVSIFFQPAEFALLVFNESHICTVERSIFINKFYPIYNLFIAINKNILNIMLENGKSVFEAYQFLKAFAKRIIAF
jgi:hypothetical protein